MRRHPLLLLPPLVLTLAACAPAAAADTVVAEPQRPSTVRSYAGIQVLSAYDGGAYRLAVRLSIAGLVRALQPPGTLSIVGLALAGPDTPDLTDASPTDDGCGVARSCQVIRTAPLRFRPVRPA